MSAVIFSIKKRKRKLLRKTIGFFDWYAGGFGSPALPPGDEWILELGVWNDFGIWIDSDIWRDVNVLIIWVMQDGAWNDSGTWSDINNWKDAP